jgi:hypothetical protein
MLKLATAEFKEWLKMRLSFPYSHMMVTRANFYCKWVMLRADIDGEGVRGVATEKFPVLASTLGHERLQQVIMSGEAKPLSKDMADIMDDMFVWGQSRSYHWYCNVVDLMHNWLVCSMDVPKKEMVRACIAMEVKSLIFTYFAVNSIVGHTIYMNWYHVWFDTGYTHAIDDFQAVALNSLDYVSAEIAHHNYLAIQ